MTFYPKHTDPRTVEGQLLWPVRMPEDAVRGMETRLGEYGTAGQLQQHPAPRGGGIVRREHFRFYPSHAGMGFDFLALSVDAAFKDAETSSYVVVQAWGRKPPNSYLLDQMRDRMSFTKTLAAIRAMKIKFPQANAVLIEDKANGPAIINVLQREIPGVLPIEPQGSKPARAEAVAPLIQAGNVYLPDSQLNPWVEGFISEWCAVPTAAFWDQVDASGQYLLKYGRVGQVGVSAGAAVVGGASAEEFGGGAAGGIATESGAPWSDAGAPWDM